jgi:hypothetical protein
LTRFTCRSGYAASSWVTSTPSTLQARRISRSEHTVTITSRARAGSDRASSFVAMTLQVRADIGSADAALLLLQSATLARARGFDDRRQDHEPATLETDTEAVGTVRQRFPSRPGRPIEVALICVRDHPSADRHGGYGPPTPSGPAPVLDGRVWSARAVPSSALRRWPPPKVARNRVVLQERASIRE